jgi:hypothetical protein
VLVEVGLDMRLLFLLLFISKNDLSLDHLILLFFLGKFLFEAELFFLENCERSCKIILCPFVALLCLAKGVDLLADNLIILLQLNPSGVRVEIDLMGKSGTGGVDG